jgi:N-acetylglucosamine-6-sulfatase
MVLTLDLAPTLLEFAGLTPPATMQGRSLLPILTGHTTEWRGDFLIEYFTDTVFPRIQKMGYQAVRTQRWKLIHYTELPDMDELYDLEADPYEMQNVIANPSAKAMRDQMQTRIEQMCGNR